MSRPRRTLTALHPTVGKPPAGQRRWFAESTERAPGTSDPLWRYECDEDVRTVWAILHSPTGRWLEGFPTLTACRAATADGSALAEVEQLVQEAQVTA